jgi:ABC-2 type transport system ATP-binding protein
MKLEVKDIRKSFGEREILHGISFEVVSGKAMGFLGRNGAGKSTTIRCLMDVFHQDSGEFLLDGKPFKTGDYRIGYLPEERGMYAKNKVLNQLTYFAMLRGADKASAEKSAMEWIDFFNLGDYAKRPLEHLSKGNQQKIQIAQAFLNDPDILILDEPFSGLDPVNAQVFKNAVADFVKRGKLVIFSSHQMGYVEEVCDDVTLIHDGSILLSGDLDEIKRARGENKLLLEVDAVADEEVIQAIQTAFPGTQGTPYLADKGVILDTHNTATQQQMLTYLAGSNWTIARFGLYEPSLNDIFVSTVGGEKA